MSSILIDPMAVCCALWAFYLCDRLLDPSGSSRTIWLLFTLNCMITAGIKPLYLFAVCVLMAATLIQRRQLTPPLLKASVSMVLAGTLFFAWNTHATHVNDTSFFTRDFRPTMLLGFSELFSFAFIRRVGRWVLIEMVGPLAGLSIVGGLLLIVTRQGNLTGAQRGFLLICALAFLGYWAAFAHITYIHDYYSLIAVPFCAILGGAFCAVCGRAVAARIDRLDYSVFGSGIAVLGAAASTALFTLTRGFPASTSAQDFARLSAGHFERFAYAMIFVSPDRSPGGNPIHEAPVMLDAAGVRGTAMVVSDSTQAREQWERFTPHYKSLRYVVFFGLAAPPEVAAASGPPVLHDENTRLTIFDLAHRP